jgi:hypothetical protein
MNSLQVWGLDITTQSWMMKLRQQMKEWDLDHNLSVSAAYALYKYGDHLRGEVVVV